MTWTLANIFDLASWTYSCLWYRSENGTSSTGSVLAVSFGTVFKAAPVSVIANQIDGAYALIGSITTTGFTVNTVGASKVVYWSAVGSGSQ